MTTITITEGLAEIKTIGKRLESKRDFIFQYLARQEGLKDPLEKDGGSVAAVDAASQSMADLETRIVRIRCAINDTNGVTSITIAGVTHTIAEWLIWRRAVAPGTGQFFDRLRNGLVQLREQAQRKGYKVITEGQAPTEQSDLIVNLSESHLAKKSEAFEEMIGTLDGQLSLKNATTMITFSD